MLTFEKAEYLLQLSKTVYINEEEKKTISIEQKFPFQKKYILISPEDRNYIFIYDINQSSKNKFKLSLYLFDDETKIGLLRIDFNGGHTNPQTANEKVPEKFLPYMGKKFDYTDSHVHYYVEDYGISWAMPLNEDSFPIKDITNSNDILQAFLKFNSTINLTTVFLINQLLI